MISALILLPPMCMYIIIALTTITIRHTISCSFALQNSPICIAALHAGIVTKVAGGMVNVTMHPDLSSYVGSVQNGIASKKLDRALQK